MAAIGAFAQGTTPLTTAAAAPAAFRGPTASSTFSSAIACLARTPNRILHINVPSWLPFSLAFMLVPMIAIKLMTTDPTATISSYILTVGLYLFALGPLTEVGSTALIEAGSAIFAEETGSTVASRISQRVTVRKKDVQVALETTISLTTLIATCYCYSVVNLAHTRFRMGLRAFFTIGSAGPNALLNANEMHSLITTILIATAHLASLKGWARLTQFLKLALPIILATIWAMGGSLALYSATANASETLGIVSETQSSNTLLLIINTFGLNFQPTLEALLSILSPIIELLYRGTTRASNSIFRTNFNSKRYQQIPKEPVDKLRERILEILKKADQTERFLKRMQAKIAAHPTTLEDKTLEIPLEDGTLNISLGNTTLESTLEETTNEITQLYPKFNPREAWRPQLDKTFFVHTIAMLLAGISAFGYWQVVSQQTATMQETPATGRIGKMTSAFLTWLSSSFNTSTLDSARILNVPNFFFPFVIALLGYVGLARYIKDCTVMGVRNVSPLSHFTHILTTILGASSGGTTFAMGGLTFYAWLGVINATGINSTGGRPVITHFYNDYFAYDPVARTDLKTAQESFLTAVKDANSINDICKAFKIWIETRAEITNAYNQRHTTPPAGYAALGNGTTTASAALPSWRTNGSAAIATAAPAAP